MAIRTTEMCVALTGKPAVSGCLVAAATAAVGGMSPRDDEPSMALCSPQTANHGGNIAGGWRWRGKQSGRGQGEMEDGDNEAGVGWGPLIMATREGTSEEALTITKVAS